MSSTKFVSCMSVANGATAVAVKQNSAIAAERNGRSAIAETMTRVDLDYVLPEA